MASAGKVLVNQETVLWQEKLRCSSLSKDEKVASPGKLASKGKKRAIAKEDRVEG